MRVLRIQFQPERAPDLDPVAVVEVLKVVGGNGRLASRVQLTEGADDGPHIDATYSTPDPVTLWASVCEQVLKHATLGPALRQAVLIVCTGDIGWDDYLLLHHFDDAEPLDELA